jgi:BirA family transcriptional regulator, biotin operon repressor / biotin---[acetyl-CoA-carboxylase] ligase
VTRVLSALPASYRLVFFETIGSTNDEAKRLARAGGAEGTVVWALQQTAGRGRRGRRWLSPPGNLYASLVLRPDCPGARAAQLGFAAALASCDALAELVPGLGGLACKWPNDVLLGGCKIAGILLESEVGKGDALAWLVLGLGVNLAWAPSATEFPATSLAGQGLEPVPPAAMLEAFARHFCAWAQRWREGGFAAVREAWKQRAALLGEPIQVRLENVTLRGRCLDLDAQGALLLETGDGVRRISAGEVFPTNL